MYVFLIILTVIFGLLFVVATIFAIANFAVDVFSKGGDGGSCLLGGLGIIAALFAMGLLSIPTCYPYEQETGTPTRFGAEVTYKEIGDDDSYRLYYTSSHGGDVVEVELDDFAELKVGDPVTIQVTKTVYHTIVGEREEVTYQLVT